MVDCRDIVTGKEAEIHIKIRHLSRANDRDEQKLSTARGAELTRINNRIKNRKVEISRLQKKLQKIKR